MNFPISKGWHRAAGAAAAATAALAALCIVAAAPMPARAQSAAERAMERSNKGVVEIVAGSVDGSDLRIASDLSTVLDDGATRRVLPIVGKGSLQNLTDLIALRGTDLAIVQSDVLAYAKAKKLYRGQEGALTYVAKLYNQEFHLLARDDVKTVQDLQGKPVNYDVQGSGTAITAAAVFDSLKIGVTPTFHDQAAAIEMLKSGQIAALAFVAAKPAPLFQTLRNDDGFHFLSVPVGGDLQASYYPARLSAEDYPNLFGANGSVDTPAVGTVMLVAGLPPNTERYRSVAAFVDAFFTQFDKLLEVPRHPKWQEVNLAADLPGWRRFAPADAWLKAHPSSAPGLNEAQMRDLFVKFLDERSHASSGKGLTAQQKEDLFSQFQAWQQAATQRR